MQEYAKLEVMGRKSRKRPYHEPHQPLDMDRLMRAIPMSHQTRRGDSYSVRTVAGNEKSYICPGCHQQIPPNTAHVVAWSNDHLFGNDAGLSERRHWHKGCWRQHSR